MSTITGPAQLRALADSNDTDAPLEMPLLENSAAWEREQAELARLTARLDLLLNKWRDSSYGYHGDEVVRTKLWMISELEEALRVQPAPADAGLSNGPKLLRGLALEGYDEGLSGLAETLERLAGEWEAERAARAGHKKDGQ